MISWDRPGWVRSAKCLGSHLFYPESDVCLVETAKAVCNGLDGQPACSVRRECLEYALEQRERFGVWGGCAEDERRAILRNQRREVAVRVIQRKGSLRSLLDAAKTDTRVLGPVQHFLSTRPSAEREMDWVHPSEMCKSNWCPRATFYRLAGAPAGLASQNSFVLENVFQEGHDIHRKWQTWLWEMGLLRGEWGCRNCEEVWSGTAPKECPVCLGTELYYREVPLRDERYHVLGHADGDIADDASEQDCPLLEIKSIGIGTLRFEAMGLLAEHTHKAEEGTWVDYEGIWREIRRPFPSHLRQGNLYMALKGRKSMVFIYECKWNQQVKEFIVRYQPALVENLLSDCLDIQHSMQVERAPHRPFWATGQESETCRSCVYSDTCYSEDEIGAGETEPGAGTDRSERSGTGSGGAGRVQAPGPAEIRDPAAADQGVRIIRRRPHEPVREVDTVG